MKDWMNNYYELELMKTTSSRFFETEPNILINFDNTLSLMLIETSDGWYVQCDGAVGTQRIKVFSGTEKECRNYLDYVKTNFNFFYETGFDSLINLNNLFGVELVNHTDHSTVNGYGVGDDIQVVLFAGTDKECKECLKELKKRLRTSTNPINLDKAEKYRTLLRPKAKWRESNASVTDGYEWPPTIYRLQSTDEKADEKDKPSKDETPTYNYKPGIFISWLVHGIRPEDVMEIVLERVEALDNLLPCTENKKVIFHLKEAIRWEEKRKLRREMQSVSGTLEPHNSDEDA